MPLVMIVRDVLGLAKSVREVRTILHNKLVRIDGRIVKDPRIGVGLMDVLTLGEQHFRCVLDQNGKLRYRQIAESDAGWKVCRIEGKTTIKGGKTQLSLHDGRCIIVDDANAYSSGDSLKISLPGQDIIEHLSFTDGCASYLIGGSHVGNIAYVKEYLVKRSSMSNEVNFENFGTIARHVFVVNDATPLPGVEVRV
jgi:small subunit ribosomal protein S4e